MPSVDVNQARRPLGAVDLGVHVVISSCKVMGSASDVEDDDAKGPHLPNQEREYRVRVNLLQRRPQSTLSHRSLKMTNCEAFFGIVCLDWQLWMKASELTG